MEEKYALLIPVVVVMLMLTFAAAPGKSRIPIKPTEFKMYAEPITNTTESLLERIFGPAKTRGKKKKKMWK